ncbi:MAG: hypothetical protein N2Z22_09195 [Turneriella sp.]|nr:hypothetical protein [Leptospiraceae bacterium]MCX7633490.1 hypothetical protein [Turneriella sp.]
MAAGIGIFLGISALMMVLITFRSGVPLYRKVLGWCVLAALLWLYQAELQASWVVLASGNFRQLMREWANAMQVAFPVVSGLLLLVAFLTAAPRDAGIILLLLFLLFIISTVIKIAALV